MQSNPWEEVGDGPVLFIVDAAHGVEEQHLLDWLERGKQQSNYKGSVEYVTVPIAHDPENLVTTELQSRLDIAAATLLVPVRIIWKIGAQRINNKPRLRDLLSGNPRLPGASKARDILLNHPDRAVCVAAKPATLQQLQERFDQRQKNASVDKNLADYVAGQASLALEVAERRLRGSRYRVPRRVATQIRASDRFKQGVLEISEATGQTEAELRQQAIPIFKELVAVPQNFWQDVVAAGYRKVISMGYDDQLVVDQQRLARFRQIVREHPTALLWTHKTHIDGPTIHSVLFENDFPTPHILGGINMAFAGVGFLTRRAGAIFIRRSFQDNPLYKLILRNYLGYLLEKRFPLTWSFEGTRSRVGKLMPPRYGLLKYVMEAVANSSAEHLYIIPVAINYDMINDVKDYAAEQGGAIKRPESLSWFISYLRRLRQPLGRIYIDFGEPVIVARSSITDDDLALAKTAFKVGVEANRVTPVTLTSLLCMALLGAAPRAQTIDELRAGMAIFVEWLERREIRLTSDFDENNVKRMLTLVNAMVSSELINRYDEGPETVYAVAADQHMQASYYRNTIVHHFVSKAIAELALLYASKRKGDGLANFWSEAERLRDMFKFEFFYSPSEEFHAEVTEELGYFDPDWEAKLKADASSARDLLENMSPLVAHSTLRPYIEAYRTVADVFASLDDKQTLDEKTAVARSFKYGRQAYLQRRISSKASIGDILFKNAYKVLDGYGLVGEAGDDLQEQRKLASKNFRKLSHRLEQIRVMALPRDID